MAKLSLCLFVSLLLGAAEFVLADEATETPTEQPVKAVKPLDTDATSVKPSEDLSIEELTVRARKSVVVISFFGRTGRQAGLGTGFVISPDGLIATNLHVIGEARPISVKTADGRQYDVKEIYATERSMDLAVLRIGAKNLPALELADSDTLKQGQEIIALGNPQGLQHSVVSGVVSGRREIDGKPMIQLAIPIEPGNSGGPLLDMRGHVHGLLTLKSTVTRNLGFAVAINALKPLLEKPNPIPMSRWLTIGALDKQEWTPLFGANWRQRAGRILVDGRGKGFGGRSLNLSTTQPPELPYEVAVWVNLDDEAGAAGLVFHSDGKQRHYGFYPSNGRLRMSRFDGPDVYSWHVLKEVRSRAYRVGDWNRLKVSLQKDKIQCFVNDELVIESNDIRYTNGLVGLAKFRDTEAEFKGFQIEKEIADSKPSAEVSERIVKLVETIPTERPPTGELIDKLSDEAGNSALVLRNRARLLERQADRLRQLASALQEKKARQSIVELLKKEEDEIDLLHVALLVSSIDNSELDVAGYLKEIGRMVGELKSMVGKEADEQTKLAALNKFLFKELGFHGSRTDYYNRSNSYLNEVIDDREGLPITLSVLYMELARRIDLKVVGVGLPGHFVVRFEPSEGKGTLIDPYDRGATLSREQADVMVRAIAGRPLEEAHLAAQTKKAILLRMLNNLMGIARETQDSEAMLRYVDTMLAIEADSPQFHWFRAVLRFQTERIAEAIEDTEWILAREPDGVDMQLVRQLRRTLDEATR